MHRQVVITGMGLISPIGNDVDSAWQSAIKGRSGIDRINAFDPSNLKSQIAGEVKDFNPLQYLERSDVRRMDRVVQLGVSAAGQALDDAGWDADKMDPQRAGVIIGSGVAGVMTIIKQQKVLEEKGASRVSPFMVPAIIADMAAGLTAIKFGLQGPNMAISAACATGTFVIGESAEIIARGAADVMLAGGSEAAICELALAGMDSMGALCCTFNHSPELASRPFDKDRAGFVFGEGGAALLLEEREHAQARGAHIYAEVLGYGATNDAYHLAAPDPQAKGVIRSMQLALEQAKLCPEQINYINAHGTSTILNDKSETLAVKNVFGDSAYNVPISSTKSISGHLLGAAGVLEAILCVKALETGIIPPTINYTTPDPECDLDYVPNTARQADLHFVLSNSFGFGGHNASIILGRSH